MAVNMEKTLKEVLQVVQNKAKIQKEIDALIIVREDIKMNTAKEQKKANSEMEEFTSVNNQAINKLLDQKSRLEGALNTLKNEINAKKGSIINFDKQIVGPPGLLKTNSPQWHFPA